ncbi:hypothetical protein [Paraliomyxa miuraensis]|uniref:hypothetical protein n=1 Tax=Paraliomyxa miuraensis TaxID=376150 RepID=UPI00224F480E|nr:hypothetical protein [Paraliomyxa miuraensis]MCX4244711.1 hypothetical protein [Paraliomyxa miuraensis]
MVRVADIIGALLRGLTTARIQSDVFSSQASQQYLDDQNLRSYPVPRAEIRQADVTMRVAVQDTVQRNIDDDSIVELSLIEALASYLHTLLAISVPAASDATLVQPLSQHLADQGDAFTEQVTETLASYISANLDPVKTELLESPKSFGSKTWRNQTIAAMEAAAVALAADVDLGGSQFPKGVQAAATAFADAMHLQVQLELDLALAAFFDLDLAVKKDQIITLPEHVMSEIKLQVTMDNYEWTSVKNAQGVVTHRLTQK